MTILTDIRCPKCGAPMDLPENGQAPVCLHCQDPVQAKPAGTPDGNVAAYRKEWVRLEAEYRRARQAYREQIWQISGRKPESPRSTPYLNDLQKQQLEPHKAELLSRLVDVGERSNSLAMLIDRALRSRAASEPVRPPEGFPAWPAMFANVLEDKPHGPLYMEQFEPLIYELSRRDLLAPELGRIETFFPIHLMVMSMPVMITRNLEYGWAVEIHQQLQKAGAVTRIACTELVEDLAMTGGL